MAKPRSSRPSAAAIGDVPPPPGPISKEVRAAALEIHRRLEVAQPHPRVELDHENAFQLLIATILAARSNDRTINGITPTLFARWPTPAALAVAEQDEIETVIRASGFFRNKAKAIRETAQMIVAEFGGEVPATMAELLRLPGVARKTANVVLCSAFRIGSGVIVDIHVTRLVERFGWTQSKDALAIEGLLCAVFPASSWVDVGHRLVLHGRHLCTARKPQCGRCPIQEVCPSAAEEPLGPWTARAAEVRRRAEAGGEGSSAP